MTAKSPDPRIAVFAGSFNPYTIGHADILRRGLEIFDRIDICIGVNFNKPEAHAQARDRLAEILRLYADEPRVTVNIWGGQTADYAKKIGAHFLLRGARSVKDFEYEREMADANRAVFGLETVILLAQPELSWISSSLVRELQAYGQDVSQFLPPIPQ